MNRISYFWSCSSSVRNVEAVAEAYILNLQKKQCEAQFAQFDFVVCAMFRPIFCQELIENRKVGQ